MDVFLIPVWMKNRYIEKLLRWLIFQEARKIQVEGLKMKQKYGEDGIGIKFYFLPKILYRGPLMPSQPWNSVPFLPKNQADRWWDSFFKNIGDGVATTFWSNVGAALWLNNIKLTTISCIEKQLLRIYLQLIRFRPFWISRLKAVNHMINGCESQSWLLKLMVAFPLASHFKKPLSPSLFPWPIFFSRKPYLFRVA